MVVASTFDAMTSPVAIVDGATSRREAHLGRMGRLRHAGIRRATDDLDVNEVCDDGDEKYRKKHEDDPVPGPSLRHHAVCSVLTMPHTKNLPRACGQRSLRRFGACP